MDEYRSDFAAAREHIEALEARVEEAERELEASRALVKVHEASVHALETKVAAQKPTPRAALGVVVGLALMGAFALGSAFGEVRQKDRSNNERWRAIQSCEQKVTRCLNDVADVKRECAALDQLRYRP